MNESFPEFQENVLKELIDTTQIHIWMKNKEMNWSKLKHWEEWRIADNYIYLVICDEITIRPWPAGNMVSCTYIFMGDGGRRIS